MTVASTDQGGTHVVRLLSFIHDLYLGSLVLPWADDYLYDDSYKGSEQHMHMSDQPSRLPLLWNGRPYQCDQDNHSVVE